MLDQIVVDSTQPFALFVDDEEMTRYYFKRYFGRKYNLYLVGDLPSAYAALSEHAENISMILTDQKMPGGNGIELLTYASENYPTIKRYLTSAFVDQAKLMPYIEAGQVHDILNKPWDLQAVDDLLAEHIISDNV